MYSQFFKKDNIDSIVQKIHEIKDMNEYMENSFLKEASFNINSHREKNGETYFHVHIKEKLKDLIIEKYNLKNEYLGNTGNIYEIYQKDLIQNENWKLLAENSLKEYLDSIKSYTPLQLLQYLEKKGEFTYILKIPRVTKELPIELFKKECGIYIKASIKENYYYIEFNFENYDNKNKCIVCRIDSLHSIFDIPMYIKDCEYCNFLYMENYN